MSRTDAHAPYWTWAPWYEPAHSPFCAGACDLPERPVRHAGCRTRVYVPLCTWEPVWPNLRDARWLIWRARTPAWFVHHVWSGTERRRRRDDLGEMVKEYNATGHLEDGDFPNWQARHCARWLWD